jgi:hypothetical protein
MQQAAHSVLAAWSNFYVVTGSAAAGLTGLMFVVITLVVGNRARETTHAGVSTFSTPTVVHFGAALLVSAMLCAPWRSLTYVAVLLGITGLFGAVYVIHLMLRTKRLTTYRAEIDDWIWYTILPLVAYGAMVVVAILLPNVPAGVLFVLAGAVLLLIFIGIHNAWDIVTYIAVEQSPPSSSSPAPEDSENHREPSPNALPASARSGRSPRSG